MSVSHELQNKVGFALPTNEKDIILGCINYVSSHHSIINYCLLCLKYYIYLCKIKKLLPTMKGGLNFLVHEIKFEKSLSTEHIKLFVERVGTALK